MESESLPTEIILTHPRQSLGEHCLGWQPQPGTSLELDDGTYTVLERRHRYQLRAGRYRLHKIALYVQKASFPAEQTLFEGQWIVGNAQCRFNARSELLRCAINPQGPCEGCRFFEPNLSPAQ